ncbi:MAG: ATP-dependent 6-phosphofructokinase [Chloroflexi bacterium]|nr:ATP-dependent 6-phosphofructokinase [Chloroflexota bacterium]
MWQHRGGTQTATRVGGSDVNVRRLAITTGGGDCPGLNAVIRAVVKTALDEGIEVLGIEDGFDGLVLGNRVRQLGHAEVRGILPRGGTILGTTNRGNPFAYRLVENGHVRVIDRSQDCATRLSELGVDGMVVIGGDGTLKIGLEFQQLGVPVVGVPKTIDNDLSATDVTFGFDTALMTATDALDKLHTTAESHHRVMILEVMGRHAGWIAVESGLAGGADVILIPEIPYTFEGIVKKITERDFHGSHFTIMVVAEGAKLPDGSEIFQEQASQRGSARLGGIGNRIAEQLEDRIHKEVRVTVLGHLQRGGSPTAFDRILGTRFGAAAVRLAKAGKFGRMAALRGESIVDVALEDACGVMKAVAPDGEMVATARGVGVSFGDET